MVEILDLTLLSHKNGLFRLGFGGMPRRFGSPRYVDHSSELDSAIVAILRIARCVIMGENLLFAAIAVHNDLSKDCKST